MWRLVVASTLHVFFMLQFSRTHLLQQHLAHAPHCLAEAPPKQRSTRNRNAKDKLPAASRMLIPRRLIFDTHFQQFDPPNALPLACLACLNRWAS